MLFKNKKNLKHVLTNGKNEIGAIQAKIEELNTANTNKNLRITSDIMVNNYEQNRKKSFSIKSRMFSNSNVIYLLCKTGIITRESYH